MKQTAGQKNNGFTLIELLVVVAIMIIMIGLFTVNLAGQRVNRDVKIAQNELVTNLRKIQSYTLSGRNVGVNQTVRYYVAKFNTGTAYAGGYTLQAIYRDQSGVWKVSDVETVKFPKGISLSGLNINGSSVTCALVAFQTPFARTYLNDGCNPSSLPGNPYSLVDGDDYKKIVNFVTNTPGLSTTVDSKMTIALVYNQNPPVTKTVSINGITGSVEFQ